MRSPQRQTTQFVGEIRELSVDIWTVSQIKKKKEEVYKGKITLIWSSLRIQRSAKKCTSSFSSIKALKKIDAIDAKKQVCNEYFPLCMEIRIGKRGKTCGKWEMGSGESSANNTKSDLNVGPACDKSNNITQSAVAFFRFVWLGLVPHGVCVTCVLMKY